MEEKETFLCEELKVTPIESLRISLCYSLVNQLARFRFEGVSRRTTESALKLCRDDQNLLQLEHILKNKHSVSQITSQLSFAQGRTNAEFNTFVCKISRTENIEELINKFTDKLQVAVRLIKYENDERNEVFYKAGITSDCILLTIVKKDSENAASFYKTTSSIESKFDSSILSADSLKYFPFTYNPDVCEDAFNLKTVNNLLIKSLGAQKEYIPIRKLDAVMSSVCRLRDAGTRVLIDYQYYECTHSQIDRIEILCCGQSMCKMCLRERINKRNYTCLCNQRLNERSIQEINS